MILDLYDETPSTVIRKDHKPVGDWCRKLKKRVEPSSTADGRQRQHSGYYTPYLKFLLGNLSTTIKKINGERLVEPVRAYGSHTLPGAVFMEPGTKSFVVKSRGPDFIEDLVMPISEPPPMFFMSPVDEENPVYVRDRDSRNFCVIDSETMYVLTRCRRITVSSGSFYSLVVGTFRTTRDTGYPLFVDGWLHLSYDTGGTGG